MHHTIVARGPPSRIMRKAARAAGDFDISMTFEALPRSSVPSAERFLIKPVARSLNGGRGRRLEPEGAIGKMEIKMPSI